MWQAILAASLVVFLLRASPALVPSLDKLTSNPKVNKFLDYTICLISGELIYTIAFKDIPKGDHYTLHFGLTAVALIVAAATMWYTNKLAKSLIVGLMVFLGGYFLMNY